MSLLTVAIAGALVTGGVFAYFSDIETSGQNEFTAGTLYLELADNDELFGGDQNWGVTATWTMADMTPGVTTVGPFSVILYNTGSLAADHVEISFSHAITDTPNVESDTNWSSAAADMAEWIEITTMAFNGGPDFKSDFIAHDSARDPNGNGFFDLDDLTWPSYADAGGFLDNLDAPAPVNSLAFQMGLKFNAGATNDIQGDTLTTTVTFTLNQEASQ